MNFSYDDDVLIDFVTGDYVQNIGSEINRQKIELFLVFKKGYNKSDILLNAKISFRLKDLIYNSCIDLLLFFQKKEFMAFKCVAGSIDSRSREIISASRLYKPIIPICVVSDGENALIFDTISGKRIADSINYIPSVNNAGNMLNGYLTQTLSFDRIEKEKLIFSSYDSMNVNIKRKI